MSLRQAMTCARETVRSSTGFCKPAKREEVGDIDFVGAPGLPIGDVSKPFDLGGNSGELEVLGRSERRGIYRKRGRTWGSPFKYFIVLKSKGLNRSSAKIFNVLATDLGPPDLARPTGVYANVHVGLLVPGSAL